MSNKERIEYPGKTAKVTWAGDICIHIGECGRASGDLFIGGRQPWCQPDLASDDEVEEVVERCPTGALSAEFADGSHVETAPPANTIAVSYNGPLFVRGTLEIDGAPADVPGLKFRAALCRCGASKNKPFCDDSHEEAGFRDYGAVGETGKTLDALGGVLQVSPAKDGPLLLKGNLTITGGAGREAWQGTKVALCRCGESGNKPFCDGAHVNAGFRSD